MTTQTLKRVLLAVLGFVGGCCVLLTLCASVSFMKAGRLWVREWTEPPIPVEEPVMLRIQHTVGEIHLRAAEMDAVTVRVRAEVRTWWPSIAQRLLEAMDVRVYRQGGAIVLEDVMPSVPGGQTKSLDLDVTVPRHTSVVLVHDVGRVALEDLELDAGSSPALLLVLKTDTGTIDVRWPGATLHGETSKSP